MSRQPAVASALPGHDWAAISGLPAQVIVFDGHCRLCNGWVNFLLARDQNKRFHFAAVQTKIGQQLLEQAGFSALDPETMLLVSKGRVYSHTDAILRVLWQLGAGWRLLSLLRLIPERLRDPLYVAVAQRRYRWFGRTEQCRIPQADEVERFLD
ncbi:thiol-disulfide oxidoreductase DCC family protein [Permianibacter sp. IMCC34836]|uniref:thiol-disulfide oxidoreductase DCC family protein n=1 Tax=Permianibacter fluminis TaxID=2738515 RepID=UPI0015567548|nr:thiol-disulfide oxidoreductase DCC family protein [Permianibacter fluminis]NQD37197.1 thiol-disulfide oxidoreductase DCC family protein [Permianibacter fluminis]